MNDLKAGQSSQTGGSDDQDHDPSRPDTRSRVYVKPPDMQNQYPELYQIGQEVYVHGRRGSDLNPYKIYRILGSGQYKLTRNGVVENKVYLQANLKTHP
ncbi:hypothetical protein ABVK25_012308 [Lepraria finkii]|uniref:Uncharacterized protein n=1 Tax=Lepraria finkii TaxID=1340010 RepID=A0ABR4AHH0_9LECA